MTPQIAYFILFAFLLQCCQGTTQDELLLDIRNKFERLETEILHLKGEVKSLKKENNNLREELIGMKSIRQNHSRGVDEITDVIRKDKRGITPYGTIAFSAVITPNMDRNIGQYHVFIYDHVESNIGGAYNRNTGIFTAPLPGTYAFLWTIFTEGRIGFDGQYGEIDTELIVNGKKRGYAFTDTEVSADDDQATGFVIVQLNQGDAVYVRNGKIHQGTYQHYYHGMWTFSGWKIA